MSRPLAASTSRVPRSEVNVFSRENGRSSSALGKRGATEAGLDEDPSKIKRDLAKAQAKIATLERDLSTSNRLNRDLEEELTEQRGNGEAFRAQRDLIIKGEANERSRGEEREKGFAEERTRINSQLSKCRLANNALESRLEELRLQNDQATGHLAALKQEHLRDTKRLEGELGEATRQVESLKAWQRRAQSLTIDLEEQKRIVAKLREGRDDEAGEKEGDEVLRKEFRRQSQQFVLHQQQANSLKNEVAELRQFKKQAEAAERAQKEVERDLREQIWTLQEQLERSRRDMDSLTQTFPSSPSSAIPDAKTLQSRLSSLSALHSQATTDLAQKESEIRNLTARLSRQSDDSRAVTQDLTKKLLEAERECRWAKQGRAAAEKGEEFARKRAEAMNLEVFDAATHAGSFVEQPSRVAQLKKMVELYKSELDAVARDSRDLEDRLTQGAGLVKQTMLDEAQAKVETLQAEITALQSTISELTTANTTLDAEVTDLMRRVASGEYNPATERCIEFANNPAAKEKTIRRAELDQLRSENEALLEEIQALEESKEIKEGERYVPRESWERLQRENREMEAGHTKRLQRLKEIFSMKSKEFLEAVYSLLGWRIKFDESGADIRLTSMYAPKGKMGLTLKFASQEGHFGTMQMTGAMARGLEEARTFWIVERQSVPGFLAQVTTECFEKTTIGRAAGYVGLE